MNITIDWVGKPKPKARPRMVNHHIWTPSTPYENEVATLMMEHKGKFKDQTGLAFLAWFFSPDPRSDGDNLFKLVCDAAVKAGVIDDDNTKVIIHGSWEIRNKDDEGNPYPGKQATRVRIGSWL